MSLVSIPAFASRGRVLITCMLAAVLFFGCAYKNHIKDGDAAYDMGKYEVALTEYERALSRRPSSEEAQLRVADAKSAMIAVYTDEVRELMRGGDYMAAVDVYVALEQRLPDAGPVYQLGDEVVATLRLTANAAAEQREWAEALDLLMLAYDHFRDARGALEADLDGIKRAWATSLAEVARAAEIAGHEGDALLLYAKASELIALPEYVSKKDELAGRLILTRAYGVRLDAKGPAASPVVERLVNARTPQNVVFLVGEGGSRAADDGVIVRALAGVELGRARFDKSRSRYTKSKEYKSGTRQVPNPAYARVLRDIHDAKRDVLDEERDVAGEQRDLQDEQNRLSREKPGTSAYDSQQRDVERAQDNLERAQEELFRARERVLSFEQRLADTPQTVEEDVYSTLDYEVITHTVRGSLAVRGRVEHPDARERVPFELVAGVSASDDTHPAYPIASVMSDPLQLPTNASLEAHLYGQAAQFVFTAVNQSLQVWRRQILEEAFESDDEGHRVHLYVEYVLLDPTEVDPQVIAEIARLRGVPDAVSVLSRLR